MKLKKKDVGGDATGSGSQINWDHALASYVAQNMASGLVSRFSPNSQQNTIQDFNRQQFAPTNYLPYTPNVSQQAQYGFRKGGAIGGMGYWPPIKMDEGGNPFTPENILASRRSGIRDADLVDRLNATLAGGKYTGSKWDLSSDEQGLVNSANIWRQTNQGRAPQELIQGWFNRPVSNNPQDMLRQKLGKIGYGADAMYNNTPNTGVRMKKGGYLDMDDEMMDWITGGEEDAPEPPPEEQQQQEQPSQDMYDALQYAQFMQMTGMDDQQQEQAPEQMEEYKKGGIHIKKSHEGRFTAYKKRTGKTTEEALHSKDPHVRKMANFARNASKWHHGEGGLIQFKEGGEYNMSKQDIDYYRSMGYEIDEI